MDPSGATAAKPWLEGVARLMTCVKALKMNKFDEAAFWDQSSKCDCLLQVSGNLSEKACAMLLELGVSTLSGHGQATHAFQGLWQ